MPPIPAFLFVPFSAVLRRLPLACALLLCLVVSACVSTGPVNESSPLIRVAPKQNNDVSAQTVAPSEAAPRSRPALPLPTRTELNRDLLPQEASLPDNAQHAQTMLNFNEADLSSVVQALATFTGRNFVVDPRVRGPLTLVSETPVDAQTAYSMLLAALRMQGFAVVDVDGVNRVVPEADAKLLGGRVVSPNQPASAGELITRVFPLRYESATALLPVIRPMVAPNNPVAAHASNNTLVVTDYADNINRIAHVLARMDVPTALHTDVIPIEYGVAFDVAALAQQMLSDQGGEGTMRTRVLADGRSNSLLVRAATPERLKLVRDLVRRIDSPNTKTGNLHVVYLRNAQATHLAEILRNVLTAEGGQSQSQTGAGMQPPLAQSKEMSLAASVPDDAFSSSAGNDSLFSESLSAGNAPGFSADAITIQADPASNTLIISAPEPVYRSVREIIDQLDQRRAQVLIESLIVEMSAENAAELGIQWMAGGGNIDSGRSTFFGGANYQGSGLGGNLNEARTTLDALASGLSLGVVKGTTTVLGTELLDLRVLARALQTRGAANVLSTPNLMTLDNEEASIMVGNTVPFVTGSYTTSGDGASNPFQTVKREDVGLTLRIRPQISEGGTVKLALYQEVSTIDPASVASRNGVVTRKRALDTNVLVDDGQIIVLGGLLQDIISNNTSSVPLLGDIPVLGNLFKHQSRGVTKTNLMVFLRPHIVRSARDSASLTLDRYRYMQAAQAGLPNQNSSLLPEARFPALPAIESNPDTGLLDLSESALSRPD